MFSIRLRNLIHSSLSARMGPGQKLTVRGAGVSRCLTTKGVIQAGRKVEMVFEYTPTHTQLVESFFRFRILDSTLSVPVLLVGSVAEPEVRLDRAHVNFNALLLGGKSRETVYLVNE
eukprot:84381_1